MARIILEPGEAFEHYHVDESHTVHIEGSVELSVKGRPYLMRPNETVKIPANISHTIRNVGDSYATVACKGRTIGKNHVT